MAAKAKMQDQFDEFMVFGVTMSAANTLTFASVNLGLNVFQYAALILSRIEYTPARDSMSELTANTDYIEVAITGSNAIADLSIVRPEVYDRISINTAVSGAPASFQVVDKPFIHDFTTMKGGGLLVPAQNVYIGMMTGGFAAAGVAEARVYYRVIELQAPEFIELVQRLRVLST